MAGIKNDVLYGLNADFSRAGAHTASESNGLVVDADLWIGSTALNAGGTHINKGTLTSPNSSITFGYSSPNITAVVNTAVITDLHTARFIVSAGGLTDGANYTSIQTAINAAAGAGGNQTVFIQPGTYTENLTLAAGVNLCAYGPSSMFNQNTGTIPNVVIKGTCTFTSAGIVGIQGICLETNSAAALAVTGSSASQVILDKCYLNCTDNTGVTFSSSSSSSLIEFLYCSGDIATTGIALFAHSGAGQLRTLYTFFLNSGLSTTANTVSGTGFFGPNYSSFANGISLSNSASGNGGQNNYHMAAAQVCITTANTASYSEEMGLFVAGASKAISIGAGSAVALYTCFVSGSVSAVIDGTGTLTYTNLTMNSNATINSGLTISNGASNTYISGQGAGTAGQVLTSNGAYAPQTWQTPSGGKLVQQVRVNKTAAQTVTSSITAITTQPTTSTGTSVVSVSITPTNASNILLIEGNLVCTSGGNFVSAYIIQNSAGNGFGTAWQSGSAANLPMTIPIRYYMTAGGTSAITFDLYTTVQSGGNVYVNANTSGTQLSGGSAFTSLVISEIQV